MGRERFKIWVGKNDRVMPPPAICSVAGCEKPSRAKGYCKAHYLRVWRHGTTLGKPGGKHLLYRTPEYRAWINMKSRCYNHNSPNYDRYGGRGIAVCDRWLDSFEDFLADVGPRPSSLHSLDRWPDQNGDYEPNNCRWATRIEQMRNVTSNKVVLIHGKEMTLAEAVERAPVPYNTVLYRLKRGWSLEDAVSRPQQQGVRPNAA